jgi:hypothetical protein
MALYQWYVKLLIPKEIAKLSSLIVLNLSDNELTGAAPDLSALMQLTMLNLTANANLTGVLSYQAPLPQENLVKVDAGESSAQSPAIIGVIIASVVIFAIISALIAYKCYFQELFANKIRDDSVEQEEKSEIGGKTLKITGLISQGGFGYVYKGVYDGRPVAVKRLIVPTNTRDKLKLAAMFCKSHICLH